MKNLAFLLIPIITHASTCPFLNEYRDDQCVHKDLLPPHWLEITGFLIIFTAASLANATGIGGGGIHVPILMLIFNFTTHEAIPLSKSLILGGAMVSVCMNYKKMHPTEHRTLIDYQAVGLLQPMILFGTVIGVTLNRVFPDWAIIIILTIILIIASKKTFSKQVIIRALKLYETESILKIAPEHPPQESDCQLTPNEIEMSSRVGLAQADSLQHDEEGDVDTNIRKIIDIVKLPGVNIKVVQLLILSFLVLLLAAFVKGGEGMNSVIGIEQNSILYFSVIGALLLVQLLITYQVWKVSFDTLTWTTQQSARYILIAFIGGLASGLLGIGGGLVMAPLLLEIGLHPQSAAASSSLLVLFTSSSTTLQFLIHGVLKLDYALLLCPISMISSIFGINFLNSLVTKYKRSSIIVFALAGAITLCAFLLPISEIIKQQKSFNNIQKMILVKKSAITLRSSQPWSYVAFDENTEHVILSSRRQAALATNSGQMYICLSEYPFRSVAISENGKYLAGQRKKSGKFVIQDRVLKNIIEIQPPPGLKSRVQIYIEDGNLLLATDKLWLYQTGKKKQV